MKKKMLFVVAVVVFSIVVGITVNGQLQRVSSSRQVWEYKTLVFTIRGSAATLHEDGKPVPGSATPVTRAPELGTQGWELVSVAGTVEVSEVNRSTTYLYVYWFKRPQ